MGRIRGGQRTSPNLPLPRPCQWEELASHRQVGGARPHQYSPFSHAVSGPGTRIAAASSLNPASRVGCTATLQARQVDLVAKTRLVLPVREVPGFSSNPATTRRIHLRRPDLLGLPCDWLRIPDFFLAWTVIKDETILLMAKPKKELNLEPIKSLFLRPSIGDQWSGFRSASVSRPERREMAEVSRGSKK